MAAESADENKIPDLESLLKEEVDWPKKRSDGSRFSLVASLSLGVLSLTTAAFGVVILTGMFVLSTVLLTQVLLATSFLASALFLLGAACIGTHASFCNNRMSKDSKNAIDF